MTTLPIRSICTLVVTIICGGCATDVASRGGGSVPNMHTVVPNTLVRGGQPDARGFKTLRDDFGVGVVVNLNDSTEKSEASVVGGLGMKYVPLPSNARRPDQAKLLAFLHAMEEAATGKGGAVFVHCQAGMDRTGLAVACYRIMCDGWDADRALAELSQHQAFPHGLMFPGIPTYVRGIYRDRETWRRRLAESRQPTPITVAATDAADATR